MNIENTARPDPRSTETALAPYADPHHPSNKLRPRVRCLGCGQRGCVTYWGPWCFDCNVERLDRINRRFDRLRAALERGESQP